MQDVPEIVHLDVQLRHFGVDVLAGRSPAVEHERRALGGGGEVAADDEIGLALRAFELNLNVTLLLVVLDERLEVLSTIQKLYKDGLT